MGFPLEFTTVGFGAFGAAPEETLRAEWAAQNSRFRPSSTDDDSAKRLRRAEDPWNDVAWDTGNDERAGK